MRHHHYILPSGEVIRISARFRPSSVCRPRSGTWIVREFTQGKWAIACFPEITWGQLKLYEYIGSVPLPKE